MASKAELGPNTLTTDDELKNSRGLAGPSVADWRGGYSAADSAAQSVTQVTPVRYSRPVCCDTTPTSTRGASALSLSCCQLAAAATPDR